MKKLMWISSAVLGLGTLSIAMANVPTGHVITDDTAIYQKLSEINVEKTRGLQFDSDIERLSSLEGRYREKLPRASMPGVSGAVKRISQQKYHPARKVVSSQ